jgi:hypothetical protein
LSVVGRFHVFAQEEEEEEEGTVGPPAVAVVAAAGKRRRNTRRRGKSLASWHWRLGRFVVVSAKEILVRLHSMISRGEEIAL